MTTQTPAESLESAPHLQRLKDNLARIEELSRRLAQAVAHRRPSDPALTGPGQDLYLKAASAALGEVLQNPARLWQQQAEYWAKSLQNYLEVQQTVLAQGGEGEASPPPSDRRFAHPLWQENPYFRFLRAQYALNAEALLGALASLETLSPEDRQRAEYFTRQVTELLAPSNFLATNPQALERAAETDGESLVRGLENLVQDVEAHQGEWLVTLADPTAFHLGENIATTPGAVVYRNKMMELLQYAPTTEKVHALPLIIFPPWINKYYVLDLSPQNSLIKWLVDQGFTVFVVSWVNPDASYAGVGLDDYVRDGYLQAIETAKAITGAPQVNTVGYCIAGTTLALTLGYLAKKGDASVRSATFFTTLTDFSDPGEFLPFLQDDFVDGIARQVAQDGVLDRFFMARTFSYLRPSDLVYQPAVRRYLMGEPPPAFDLLYWNGDGTHLPGKMAVEYLRGLCQQNRLAQGGFKVLGEKVELADIETPLCAIACESDHIAAWRASYAGVRQMGGRERHFILAQSGHIAGIVNPPAKGKYGYYTAKGLPAEAEAFRAKATFTPGSWWPHWGEWLARRAGGLMAARGLGDAAHPPLTPAPGLYVRGERPVPEAAKATPAKRQASAPPKPTKKAAPPVPPKKKAAPKPAARAPAKTKPRAKP
jgi:polyhydroxyalkanoate synthase